MSLKFRLKHSAVANKAPLPADLIEGELVLNINATSPAAYIKDSTGAIVKLADAGAGLANLPEATTTAKGVVTLADSAAISAGTAGRVVDAAQLRASTYPNGIRNADIAADAAIDGTKIAAASTAAAGAVRLTDSTGSTSITTAATPSAVKAAYDLADAALPKAGGNVTGPITLEGQNQLRLADADSDRYVALRAPAAITDNVVWTLPGADGSPGQTLITNGSGALSWGTGSGGGGGGDVTLAGDNAFTGANSFYNTAGQIFGNAPNQDSIVLAGRAAGTSGFTVKLVPGTLSAARTLTLPNVTGTVVTTGDSATVTNNMLAGSIATSKLTASTISGVGLGGNLANLSLGTGLSGNAYNGSSPSTFSVTYGTTAGTACQGNDSRLSDSRPSPGTLTFNSNGTGVTSGSTYNGSSNATISYNSIGAASTSGSNASGTWGISISGTAANAPWSGITGKPTTMSGYGITDGLSASASNTFTGYNQFNNISGIRVANSSAQDGVALVGRQGGSGSYSVQITPTTLTANRILTLPNVTGTVVTTGDTGTVTSTMLAADIPDSKLNTISSAGKVANSATSASTNGTANTIALRDSSGALTSTTSYLSAVSFMGTGSKPTTGIYIPTTNALGFVANSTEWFRLISSGNIQFGSAVGSANPPGYNNSTTGLQIESTNGSLFLSRADTNEALVINNNAAGTYNNVTIRRAGAVIGSIGTNGTGTSFNTTSDYRLKENVVVLTGALARLLKLKPCRFNFISDPTSTVDGFLAHEVQPIVPDAVMGEKDAVDADGKPVYQGIDHSRLVPVLVAAVQELTARVAALEAARA